MENNPSRPAEQFFWNQGDVYVALEAFLDETDWTQPRHHEAIARLMGQLAESPSAFQALWRQKKAAKIPAAEWQRLAKAAWRGSKSVPDGSMIRAWLACDEGLVRKLGRGFFTVRAEGEAIFTAAQTAAYAALKESADLFFSDRLRDARLKPRTSLLLAGPSRVGKSNVVQTFARDHDLAFLRLTYGDWIPQGAKQEPSTFDRLGEFLRQNERALIFLDELDKLGDATEGSWTTSIKNDLYGLLDRTWFDRGPGAVAGENDLRHRLHTGVLLVGAGTWQDLWAVEGGAWTPIGFRAAASLPTSQMTDRIRAARIIPTELLNRFHARIVLLTPMNQEDFAKIVKAERLDALAVQAGLSIDYEDAVASGLGMRWIENLVYDIHVALADHAAPVGRNIDAG